MWSDKESLYRFVGYVDMSAGRKGCWLYSGGKFRSGYGQFWANGRNHKAHRWFVQWAIQEELERDILALHKCHTPACVSLWPGHVYVGDQKDNMRDMFEAGRQSTYWADVTHCPQGHAYDKVNTLWYHGSRYCRACRRERTREARATPSGAVTQAAST